MADLKINRDKVLSTASTIAGINKDIDKAFNNLSSAMRTLDGHWDGPAATAAMEKYNSIYGAFYDARHNCVENYVNFLRQQVGEGYKQTEQANTKLADAFK